MNWGGGGHLPLPLALLHLCVFACGCCGLECGSLLMPREGCLGLAEVALP